MRYLQPPTPNSGICHIFTLLYCTSSPPPAAGGEGLQFPIYINLSNTGCSLDRFVWLIRDPSFCTCIQSCLLVGRPDGCVGEDGSDPTAALLGGGAGPECVGLARTGRKNAKEETGYELTGQIDRLQQGKRQFKKLSPHPPCRF